MTRFFIPRHGRTHCPGGSDPIPCLSNMAWVRRYGVNLGLAVPSGVSNDETVNFTTDAVEGSLNPSWQDYFAISTSAITNIDRHGVYEFICAVKWSGVGAKNWATLFCLHDMTGAPDGQTAVASQFGNLSAVATARWRLRCSSTEQIELSIGQLSGSSQTLDDVYLEIQYVGDYDGPERVDSAWWDQ